MIINPLFFSLLIINICYLLLSYNFKNIDKSKDSLYPVFVLSRLLYLLVDLFQNRHRSGHLVRSTVVLAGHQADARKKERHLSE